MTNETLVEAGKELLSKVRDGKNIRASLWQRCFSVDECDFAFNAYKGSLDAAKSLHSKVIPDWKWMKGFEIGGSGKERVTVWLGSDEDDCWIVFPLLVKIRPERGLSAF